MAGEGTARRLQIGNKTPTGGDLYARVDGSPKVFLIGGYLEDTFNKSPFALREKSVLKFSRDDADALSVAAGATRLTFAKSGSDWRLTAPVDARADLRLWMALGSSVSGTHGGSRVSGRYQTI